MAITKTQGYKLDSPQQNFVRDSFATVNAMVAYNTALLPDVFHTMVEENGKMYTYYVGNTVDATLGKWREVADIEGVMSLKGVWSSTTMPNCSDYKIGDTWIVGSDNNYTPYRSSITWEVGSSWTNYEYSLAQKFWAVYSEAGVILCNGEVVTGITATTITTSSSTYTFGTDEIVITASTTVSVPLNSGDELVCISSNCTTGQIWGILNNKQTVVTASTAKVTGADTAKSLNIDGEVWNLPEGGSSDDSSDGFVYKGDDAAWVRSQGKCRMPTYDEATLLTNLSDKTYVTDYNGISGLNGYVVTSGVDSTKSIFLPIAGYYSGTSINLTYGYYWSSTIVSYEDQIDLSYRLRFSSSISPYISAGSRYYGATIRPVCTTDEFDEIPEGYVEMTPGVYWAPYNLDVNPKKLSSATDWYGGYYAWGEIAPYGECDPTNWANGERTKKETYRIQYTKYYTGASMYVKYNQFDNLTTLEYYKVPVGLDIGTCDDPIFIRSDGRYECAIYEDFRDGLIACSKEWKTNYKSLSGLNGWYYTSSVDSSKGIFIPANGLFNGTSHDNTGSFCYLWTASCYGSSSDNYVNAWSIQGNNTTFSFVGGHKRWGFGMRACWNEANHPGETPPQGFVEMVDGYWWSPVNVGMIRWDKYATVCECVYGSWFSWGEIVGYNDTIDASDNHNYGSVKTNFSESTYKWLNTTGSYSMPRKYNGYDGMSGFSYSRYPQDGALAEAESGVPVGTILPTILQTAPPGWLLCDGHSELIKDYPKLHQALLITKMNSGNADVYYGIFRLPDLRANILIGGGVNDVLSATNSFMGEQHTRTYSGGSAQEYARFGVNYIIKAK